MQYIDTHRQLLTHVKNKYHVRERRREKSSFLPAHSLSTNTLVCSCKVNNARARPGCRTVCNKMGFSALKVRAYMQNAYSKDKVKTVCSVWELETGRRRKLDLPAKWQEKVTQTLNNGIDLNLINKSQYVINSHFVGKKTGPIGFKVFCPNIYNESMKLNKQNQNCMGQARTVALCPGPPWASSVSRASLPSNAA